MNIDNKASRKVHFLSIFLANWVLLLRMAVEFMLNHLILYISHVMEKPICVIIIHDNGLMLVRRRIA